MAVYTREVTGPLRRRHESGVPGLGAGAAAAGASPSSCDNPVRLPHPLVVALLSFCVVLRDNPVRLRVPLRRRRCIRRAAAASAAAAARLVAGLEARLERRLPEVILVPFEVNPRGINPFPKRLLSHLAASNANLATSLNN